MSDNTSLGSKLSYLASVGPTTNDMFGDPFADNATSVISDGIRWNNDEAKESKSKKKKIDRFDKVMADVDKIIKDFNEDDIFLFDDYIENNFGYDEDIDLRNNLINMGRKYNRSNTTSAETSEIAKTFSGNEKALSDLLSEINKDKAAIQRDIESMRMSRVKNYKTLAELVSAKNQYFSTSLQIIKESNGIKKSMIDLQAKAAAKKAASEADDASSSKAISNLFSLGRGNLLSSVGGYEAISGAVEENRPAEIMSGSLYLDDDEEIQKKYFANNSSENDGDKFLKYENLGVGYILLVHPDDRYEILAEDREGNIIPDYPMPTNISQLSFDISESTNTATDDFHRQYKVRYISED